MFNFFSSPQFLEIIILTLPLCWAVPSQCGTSKFSGEDMLDFLVTSLPGPKTLKMLLFSSLRQFSSNESYWASMQPNQIFRAFTFTMFFVLSFLIATQKIFKKFQHKISLVTAQQLSVSDQYQVFQTFQMVQTAFRPRNHCSQKKLAPWTWGTWDNTGLPTGTRGTLCG